MSHHHNSWSESFDRFDDFANTGEKDNMRNSLPSIGDFFISSKREGTPTIHQRFTQIWAISRSGPARCEVGARWKGGMPRTQGAPLSALIPTSIDVFVSQVHDKFHTSDANIYITIYI